MCHIGLVTDPIHGRRGGCIGAQDEGDNPTATSRDAPPPRLISAICLEGKWCTSVRSRGSEPRGSAELRCRLELLSTFRQDATPPSGGWRRFVRTINSNTLSTDADFDPESKLLQLRGTMPTDASRGSYSLVPGRTPGAHVQRGGPFSTRALILRPVEATGQSHR